jgi:iron-sulfur cluster assembly protein
MHELAIGVTERAADALRDLLAAQGGRAVGLRVGVQPGGCAGVRYVLAVDEQREGDVAVESRGTKVLADTASMPCLRGCVIDYGASRDAAGFRFKNPNAIASCGCGLSFRVARALDENMRPSAWVSRSAGARLHVQPCG